MSCWYEVFDNEDVQLATRRKVTALSVVAAIAATATLVCLSAMASGHISVIGAAAVIMPVWILTAVWCVARVRALRRVAWCLKISDEAILAYDYTRKKILLPWSSITRVEWTDRSALIAGPPPCTIEIPSLFSDFTALSHSLLRQAEAHQVPVYVDGGSLDLVDVYKLYPFLRELQVVSGDATRGGLTTM
jgi:hypothetical protein